MRRQQVAVLGAVLAGLLAASGLVAQTEPDTKTIPPGTSTTFGRLVCGGPQMMCRPLAFTVRSVADQTVTGTYFPELGRLSLAAPDGFAVQIVSGCLSDDGPAPVVNCSVSGLSSPPTVTVLFTTLPLATQTERVNLVAGCNNVTVTWPNGTAVEVVAAGVTPASALEAIWRFNAATRTFQGYAPLRGAPNDLTTVNRLDAIFICLRGAAELIRPASE